MGKAGWTYVRFDKAKSDELGTRWLRSTAAWRWLVEPEFDGIDQIPDSGPVLFVGNHSIMAFADASLMVAEIYRSKGKICRSLAQHTHFKIPVWGDLLTRHGAVDGTRDNCTAMMQAGEYIIVYPGGGGEVMKRQGEQHKLRWKNRTGFARMALENECTIVPFSAVGADFCYDILLDNNRISNNKLGKALIELSGLKAEEFPPLLKGLGPTLLPKPRKMLFRFHKPIVVKRPGEQYLDQASQDLRHQVETTVQTGIDELLARYPLARGRSDSDRLFQKLVGTLLNRLTSRA